jgi:hypothetical protein
MRTSREAYIKPLVEMYEAKPGEASEAVGILGK